MNCRCFYCQQGKQHKHSSGYNDKWENTGRLMVEGYAEGGRGRMWDSTNPYQTHADRTERGES